MVSLPVIARYILSLELLLGAQARFLPTLTPTLHKHELSKASGYRRHLSFIPSSNAKEHAQRVGFLMGAAGLMMLLHVDRGTTVLGTLLAGALALMGVYAQRLMGVPYWLPVVNTFLALLVLFGGGV